MFIISLTYKAPLSEVERLIPEHNDFLEKYYRQGKFIASGRKEPRTGGIILANADSRDQVMNMITEDLFHIHRIADYNVTEFLPSKYNDNFKFFIETA